MNNTQWVNEWSYQTDSLVIPFSGDSCLMKKRLVSSFRALYGNLDFVDEFLYASFLYGYLLWKHPELYSEPFKVNTHCTRLAVSLDLNMVSRGVYKVILSKDYIKERRQRTLLFTKPTGSCNLLDNIDTAKPLSYHIPLDDFPLMFDHPILGEYVKHFVIK